MEFLMTYGWAILVVLAAIGALAYFGVLSPGKLLPERTLFKAPLPNVDNAVVTLNGGVITVDIPFRNNKGSSVVINDTASTVVLSSTACASSTPTAVNLYYQNGSAMPSGTAVANGDVFRMVLTCNANGVNVGDKFKADLTFDYFTPDTGQTRPHSGTIDAEIMQG